METQDRLPKPKFYGRGPAVIPQGWRRSGNTGAIAVRSQCYRSRSAFTLIELVVVISIVAVLMSLLLPAVMSARAASRRAQCMNNLRNLGIAMIASADTARRLPASGNVGLDAAGSVQPFHSWVVNLLPWLDRRDLFEKWNFDAPQNSPENRRWANIHLSVLACPSDITVVGQGDLSYVVDGGFGWTSVSSSGVGDCPVTPNLTPLDLNGNGVTCPANTTRDGQPSDRDLYFQTGLFFIESWRVPGTVRHHTLDDVIDGMSNTTLMTENVRAGYDPFFTDVNWADPDPRRNSFFVSFAVCNGGSCSPGNVHYRRANQGAEAINAGREQPEGEAPWPSSYHAGGVHVVFGDGHVKFLSEKVDGGVYAALVSPQGSRIQGPLAQRPPSDGEY